MGLVRIEKGYLSPDKGLISILAARKGYKFLSTRVAWGKKNSREKKKTRNTGAVSNFSGQPSNFHTGPARSKPISAFVGGRPRSSFTAVLFIQLGLSALITVDAPGVRNTYRKKTVKAVHAAAEKAGEGSAQKV